MTNMLPLDSIEFPTDYASAYELAIQLKDVGFTGNPDADRVLAHNYLAAVSELAGAHVVLCAATRELETEAAQATEWAARELPVDGQRLISVAKKVRDAYDAKKSAERQLKGAVRVIKSFA